jgi:hypothetical protein
LLDTGGIPSQFILARQINSGKVMGVMSNMLKQMNAKIRQDLYHIDFPCFKETMIIGIDVIMNGANKLIGMCATSNGNLTKCFSRVVKQRLVRHEGPLPKGLTFRETQELKTTKDRAAIIEKFVYDAVDRYFKSMKALPKQVVIYRDGMGGPSLTALVEKLEVGVITNMLENTAPGYHPKIIYCLVDRNIQHRLFHKLQGDTVNPGPGTCVDTGVVESQGDQLYDFYLIPHKATVATA